MAVIPSPSRMPEGMNLEVRTSRFDLNEQLSKEWLDKDAFKAAFFNALSMTFPAGERFFIDSVRHYKTDVTDPKLKQEISHFIGQEGMHSRERRKYNRILCELGGYSQEKMEGRTEKMIQLGKAKMPPMARLAATGGVEHLTAILADKILNGWMMSDVHPQMRSLREWHCVGKLVHKSVAFDVYTNMDGSYKARKTTL